MVIVRESPRARLSPDKASGTEWPPKSPFQALLSSPSGRRKWQEQASRRSGAPRSVSPSPGKKSLASSRALQAIAGALDKDGEEDMGSLDDGEEDDDEEARAELELARIEAKLRLDNIRRKKKRLAADGGGGLGGGDGDDGGDSSGRASSRRADSRATSPRKPLGTAVLQPKLRYQTDVEVPHSPLRHRPPPTEHVSPARKRLGLHAPAKAVDVSLKRARDGTQVMQPTSSAQPDAPPGKSFNERLRATVERANNREAKYDRIESSRSKGFGAISTTPGETRRRLKEGSPIPTRAAGNETERPSSARGAQTSSARTTKEPSISGSASVRSTQSRSQPRPTVNAVFRQPGNRRTPEADPSVPAPDSDDDDNNNNNDDDQHPSSYDPFSSLHLTKRHIPHPTLTRALSQKQVYTLPRLLKEVKTPHYDPPDCDTDYVLFALLASKSTPYDQKATHRSTDENQPQDDAHAPKNKFMVLKLTDLTWEIDLFLFGTAFTQFWKLTPGTLLAILNPDILPPSQAQQHSGKFSLKLGSSEDSVMEIGVGRDLGWCSSVRKDGRECGDWVDKRKTDICGFHLDLFVERQRKGRMEVNGMWRGRGDGEGGGKGARAAVPRQGSPKRRQTGVTQSREYGNLPGQRGGPSTASLLDAEDTNRLASWTDPEKSRQRIAASQKERDLQRQLNRLASEGNDSVGAQYMRATAKTSTNLTPEDQTKSADVGQGSKPYFEKPSAASLGLLGKVAGEVRMSPLKDRKRHFGSKAVSKTGGREAVGWGGAGRALDRGLGAGGGMGGQSGLERGQKTLSGALSGDAATTAALTCASGGNAGLGIATANPAETFARPTAMRARSRDGSLSPAKKRARFMLAGKGFREPGGRESGGVELGVVGGTGAQDDGDHDKDDDDDEEGLEIV
ncbi:hypothetical protein LTR91_022986 [Friedmanniomyces endolithicus]|uniref:Zinc finger Mcm10/DnaG-type domain-containing protein n=1 Tax=Friedmanniomyces endolithicus TaxID=329885 RepID=A0AAN6H461_9PEZI|nr:hypothetical protein LTR94_017816 [Friedmanniomyces endolithicus]KAK0777126.1 hypothetical protein LTR59_013958 [Friedmanniomyces endolithicus]KAK0789489.1 hypothetical protein LTR75_012325 [Friedmanniomyces endolithicus]KAK0806406.1 hypothetical protein LTR38_005252 [Friedmanniomyces endolithicus]KAK0837257.1 hypothetical protein LTR03_012968 [Friedmanniomyces endolithicus]